MTFKIEMMPQVMTLPVFNFTGIVVKAKPVQFKIILLGNSGVGKTCIINKYTKNIFNEMTKTTIGVDCLNKMLLKEDLRSSSTSVDGNHKNEEI